MGNDGPILYVDWLNGVLRVEVTVGTLRSHQVSQLSYFGFRCEDSRSRFEKQELNIEVFLNRLLSFFDKEAISYELSESLQEISERQQDLRGALQSIKERAAQFKSGQLAKVDFQEFCDSLHQRLARRLKDHQLKAAYHHFIVRNAANFSVPGSGKTAVVLAHYERLKQDGVVNFLFVVGPPSSFGPWRREFELTLGRKPMSRVLAGGDVDARRKDYLFSESEIIELYLSTFQTLTNDEQDVAFLFRQQRAKPMFVVDEAHYLKQQDGLWANAALRIARNAQVRCALTGTPMPKSYTDVFNLFSLLWPETEAIPNISRLKVAQAEKQKDYEAARLELRSHISPLYYRVRKSELGLKEASFHPPIVIPMNNLERKVYDAVYGRISRLALSDYMKDAALLDSLRRARIMRLRQCVSYPKLLESAVAAAEDTLLDADSVLLKAIRDYDDMEHPHKVEVLESMIQERMACGDKVLVWSNFVGSLNMIARYLASHGVVTKLIYGRTPIEQNSVSEEETREQIIQEFLNPESSLNVLLANPAACAESISLHTQCHHAIYYDLSYNCAQYLQSLDRIHRVGGCENWDTHYYFLAYSDSVDADIRNNLEQKKARMDALIGEDCAVYSLDMQEDSSDDVDAFKRLFVQ